MKLEKVGDCSFITGVRGKIVLTAEENGYFPLFTIILNGDEKIFYKDYSILHILDVTLRNPNDGKLYLGDIKLYNNNIIDTDFTYIPHCALNYVTNIVVKCERNEYGELFSVMLKEEN